MSSEYPLPKTDPTYDPPSRGAVSPARLWAGGLAGAAIAALVAVIVDLIASGIFSITIISPWGDPVGMTWLVAAAVSGTLVATAALHMLMLLMPQPLLFFGWIIGLVVLVLVLLPFVGRPFDGTSLATSLGNLAIGTAIGLSVEFAGSSGFKPRRAPA